MKSSLLVSVVALSLTLPAVADHRIESFTSVTPLSPAQEVQSDPVISSGFSRARIRFNARFDQARVRISWGNLEGTFTRLHLHCAAAGANGPVALGIVDTVAPELDNSSSLEVSSGLIVGTLTQENLPATDDCAAAIGQPINNLVSLAAAIDAGLVYWNLHTDAFPAGELRGQVLKLQ